MSKELEDDTSVNITRHKKKLEQIRVKDVLEHGYDRREEGSQLDRRYLEASERSIQADRGPEQRSVEAARDGNERTENDQGAARGYDEGIRQINESSLASDPGIDRSGFTFGEGQLAPDEKKEHERELARNRKRLQRDREREEEKQQETFIFSSNRDSDRDISSGETSRPDESASRFHIKNPFKNGEPVPVKLFSGKEAETAKERLAFVYLKGSGLIDDILEIIVRGHEKVQIWQIDEGEADTLAAMHLEKAKTDEGAARSARIFLELYERIFMIELAVPRLWATGTHVREHGGLSFK